MNKEINLTDIVNYFGKLHDENWKYKQALLDIKEYIEKNGQWGYAGYEINLLDIVNKALGDKE